MAATVPYHCHSLSDCTFAFLGLIGCTCTIVCRLYAQTHLSLETIVLLYCPMGVGVDQPREPRLFLFKMGHASTRKLHQVPLAT